MASLASSLLAAALAAAALSGAAPFSPPDAESVTAAQIGEATPSGKPSAPRSTEVSGIDQLAPSAARKSPIDQLSSPAPSTAPPPQLTAAQPTAAPPPALSRSAEGRNVRLAPANGEDRCDPRSQGLPAACDRILERHADDFARQSPAEPSPEERLIASPPQPETQPSHLPSVAAPPLPASVSAVVAGVGSPANVSGVTVVTIPPPK